MKAQPLQQIAHFPLSPYRLEYSFTVPSSHLFLQTTSQQSDKTVAALRDENSGFDMKLHFPPLQLWHL